MGLFGKTQDRPPKDLINEWSIKIRKEMRIIDRQIRDIQREEEKVKRSIKDAAKKGQKDVCIILAKEMIHSKKAISKLYASKAQMNSKSTEVMKAMQSLVKVPEIQATMRELSKEMMKAGIIEEMLEDTLEGMEDEEEMEEEAEAEEPLVKHPVKSQMLCLIQWPAVPWLHQKKMRKRRRKRLRRCSPDWQH
ncbi:hypothetical protein DNTS_014418 [Danionella cerebrum]|uniref:Charged multivesicular body protein 3 n=1 Tax=Danionella cerebrum TaxID=2873325 RepID=A0A553MXJ4_9TELE|nr:hypothetical protein DNTS_014418 [Danionella translucida]